MTVPVPLLFVSSTPFAPFLELFIYVLLGLMTRSIPELTVGQWVMGQVGQQIWMGHMGQWVMGQVGQQIWMGHVGH